MVGAVGRTEGGDFATLHEFVKLARLNLSDNIWDYLTGAAETETTLKRNRLALESLAFRPRVLRDVSRVDASTTLFGRSMRMPVFLCPVGSLESFDESGAAGPAAAAAAFGIPTFVSSVTAPDLEGTAASATGSKIFQLYVRDDAAWIDAIVRRAIDAGYEAFCYTVDTAIYSRRERDLAKRFRPGGRLIASGENFQAALSWDEVKRFKDKYDLPLVIKGIATSEDAELACAHGVDAVYVSNHGGRQLDFGRGALDVLPEVVAAVRGRAPVLVDGGFCRGTDVVKALALGAQAVGIGRLYCYGLAAAGQAGVARVLELLETEVRTALGLLGVTGPGDIDSSYVHAAPPVTVPHVLSAFPLLNLADQGYGGR